ncbi:MAG: helix-turn-helix domain-containing protein [Anaerolineae bacterium]
MAHGSTILRELLAVAPEGLITSELCRRTGITSRSSVYHVARDLMLQGLVRGERSGHYWRFYALQAEQPEIPSVPLADSASFLPLSDYGWEQMRSDAGWQAFQLAPLVAMPAGRSWLMRRLASPCSITECENALALEHVQPLRDLVYFDAAAAHGDHGREDALIRYYNSLFALPESFGIEHTWRGGADKRLRLPGENGRDGWPERHLQATISTKKQLRKAQEVVDLTKLRIDLMLITARHIMLVQVFQPGAKVPLKQFELLRRYAVVLERRLQRGVSFGFIVERTEYLPAGDLLHVPWEEVIAQLCSLKTLANLPREGEE